MKTNEKTKLIQQASRLYMLGLTVEKCRKKLQRLVEGKTSYDSPQMKKALDEFNMADEEWKRLEREHLKYRKKFK